MKRIGILFLLTAVAAVSFAQDQCQSFGWANYDGQTKSTAPTGGGNVTPVQVTTFTQLKSAAESSDPKVIYIMNDMGAGYKGSAGDVLKIKSNKTIVGYKPGITVKCSWQISNASNVIVRNVICRGPGNSNSEQNWDCVNISGSKRIWFDHCTVMEGEDGNFDVVKGSDNVTATYCKFTYVTNGSHNLSNLVGSSDNEPESHGKLNITYAYCWWDNVNSRTPRTRYGKIHVLNCYYNNSGQGPHAGFMSNMRVEGCFFESNVSTPIGLTSPGGQSGCFAIDCNRGTTKTDGYSTVFTPPYEYKKYANSEVKALVTNTACGAGPNMVNPTTCCGSTVNKAPTVSITSPANNASFTSPASITINANAADADGSVSKVDFYNGTTLLGSDASSTYSYTWTNVAAGTYTITTKATDNLGAVTTSSAITVTVNALPIDCNGTVNGTATLDNCGRCIAGTTNKTACTSVGEAETDACSFDGITETKNAGFKGASYLNVDNAVGTAIIFNVAANTAGTGTLSFRYANGGTVDRPAQISVNGTVLPNNLNFPPTGTFTDWKAVDISLSLMSGQNVLKLISATTDGLPNIDQIGYVSSGLSKGGCVITGTLDSELETLNYQVYPNPSKSTFQIHLSQPTDIQVLDMEGRVCEEHKNVLNTEFGENLKSGIYFLKIENKVYKLVKE